MSKKGQRHGMVGTSTYASWFHMLQRCTNPKDQNWEQYGGRGITVCARWRVFTDFWEDMGTCPEGLTLERKNNNGNYAPGNCRWATRKEQAYNRRTSRLITVDGKTKTLFDWAAEYGVKRQMIETRIDRYGWKPKYAVTVPPLAQGGEWLTPAQRKRYLLK